MLPAILRQNLQASVASEILASNRRGSAWAAVIMTFMINRSTLHFLHHFVVCLWSAFHESLILVRR